MLDGALLSVVIFFVATVSFILGVVAGLELSKVFTKDREDAQSNRKQCK